MNIANTCVLTPSEVNDTYMRHTFKCTGCGTTHICVIHTPTL